MIYKTHVQKYKVLAILSSECISHVATELCRNLSIDFTGLYVRSLVKIRSVRGLVQKTAIIQKKTEVCFACSFTFLTCQFPHLG